MQLFDMHCHLGFANDAEAVRETLRESGVHAFSCTVTPAEYERDLARLAGADACTVALGLHPWRVADGTCEGLELARFEELASTTRFIGEVGLDFYAKRDERESRRLQQNVFEHVLRACDASLRFPRKLVSIHVVNAASEALRLLGEYDTPARHDCIFHSFKGSSEELKSAVEMGCYFSVGPRMLAKGYGREYARIIPLDRLLLETDLPERPGDAWSCEAWVAALTNTLSAIAEIRGLPEDDLAHIIAETSKDLLER